MNINDTIIDLIHLPRNFFDLGNISVYSLLVETKYFESFELISEANIREVLIRYPECIQDWITYSEDKRTNSGWYFKLNRENDYEVGYYDSKQRITQSLKYSSRIDACAAFIRHEIEEIRKSN